MILRVLLLYWIGNGKPFVKFLIFSVSEFFSQVLAILCSAYAEYIKQGGICKEGPSTELLHITVDDVRDPSQF